MEVKQEFGTVVIDYISYFHAESSQFPGVVATSSTRDGAVTTLMYKIRHVLDEEDKKCKRYKDTLILKAEKRQYQVEEFNMTIIRTY